VATSDDGLTALDQSVPGMSPSLASGVDLAGGRRYPVGPPRPAAIEAPPQSFSSFRPFGCSPPLRGPAGPLLPPPAIPATVAVFKEGVSTAELKHIDIANLSVSRANMRAGYQLKASLGLIGIERSPAAPSP
jgi:hypothetical protein